MCGGNYATYFQAYRVFQVYRVSVPRTVFALANFWDYYRFNRRLGVLRSVEVINERVVRSAGADDGHPAVSAEPASFLPVKARTLNECLHAVAGPGIIYFVVGFPAHF